MDLLFYCSVGAQILVQKRVSQCHKIMTLRNKAIERMNGTVDIDCPSCLEVLNEDLLVSKDTDSKDALKNLRIPVELYCKNLILT